MGHSCGGLLTAVNAGTFASRKPEDFYARFTMSCELFASN